MKTRKTIPTKTRALLQQEINSQCPVCESRDVDHFEVHHIDESPENNTFDNLLMLCPICHSKVTKGDITKNQVIGIKDVLKLKTANRAAKEAKGNTIKIKGTIKNSTIANTVNADTIIFKSKSKPKIEYADGSIGKKAELKNYIKHLIDRYNEYKESELGRDKMKYQLIYGAIKNEFKASAFQVPETQFEQLANYLHDRIDKTRMGKINKSKGYKNYSSFSDIYSTTTTNDN